MFQLLQIVTILLVAVAMATALAHALEWPGKLRLTKDEYLATQQIYYPGFTVAGAVGELGGIVATLLLVFVAPVGTTVFWLQLAALLVLVAMHGLYWALTHPVNSVWLRDVELKGAGKSFFSADPLARGAASADWTDLRDRWEYSHALRAVLAFAGLALLVTAATL